MISFFRDFLDGSVYLILVVICIILIMAIIGFIMERKKLEKEEKAKHVYLENATPIEPIRTREVVLSTTEPSEPVFIQNPITNPEENLKREPMFTIDSSEVNVGQTVEVNVPKEAVRVEDIVPVINFGSTSDIKIEGDENTRT